MEIILKEQELKQLLEEIIFKLFTEKREFFKEIVEEVIEDIALSKAIEEGRKNEFVSKNEIMDIIENGLLVERKIYKAKRKPKRSLSADRQASPRQRDHCSFGE